MSNAFTLPQLVSAVYTETARPDMVAETLQAVLSSTLKMHTIDLFYKDVLTASITFDSPTYIQTLDTQTLPFYRKLAYLRKDDPRYTAYEANPYSNPAPPFTIAGTVIPTSLARSFLKSISPDDILDDYLSERVDVVYQAGSTIFIRSSTALQFANAGWYSYPNLDMQNNNIGYKSWIAESYPYAIIYDAASALLQKIGLTDAARKYDYVDPNGVQQGLVASHVVALRNDNITV